MYHCLWLQQDGKANGPANSLEYEWKQSVVRRCWSINNNSIDLDTLLSFFRHNEPTGSVFQSERVQYLTRSQLAAPCTSVYLRIIIFTAQYLLLGQWCCTEIWFKQINVTHQVRLSKISFVSWSSYLMIN